MANPRILLVDPDRERRTELVERLTRLRYEVREANDGIQAIARLETEEPDLILCQLDVTGHTPKELCDYVHEFVPGHVPVVLLCPADSLEIPRLVREAGADAPIEAPFSYTQLDGICSLLLRERDLRVQVDHLQEENAQLRKAQCEKEALDPETRFYRFDIFKHVILMEVKRAKRYGYPLSLVLLAFDRYGEMAGWLNPDQRRALFTSVHREISDTIRDIDIPLLFAADKILLVMPHTSLEGSVIVADRIRARIGALKPPGSLADLRATASLAVASTEGLEEVSFGRLIQESMRALKEAELKGGDVVIVCRPPQAPGAADVQAMPTGQMGPRIFIL